MDTNTLLRRPYLEYSPGTPLGDEVRPSPRAHVKPRDIKEDMQLLEACQVPRTDVLCDGGVS